LALARTLMFSLTGWLKYLIPVQMNLVSIFFREWQLIFIRETG